MSSKTDVGKGEHKLPPLVELDTYPDVVEAWRCPHMSSGLSGPGEEHFHQDTIMRLDGAAHAQRRKAFGTLLSKRGHAYFRETFLFPAVDAALAEILAKPDADGVARVDLLRWARRVNQQLAAAITGLDAATAPEGAQRLFDLMELVLAGRPGAYQVALGGYDETTPAARAALEARREIVEAFYEPALERRRTILEESGSGTLPQDLLSLIAREADPAWKDPELARRDAVFLLSAAVHTTSSSLVWVLLELFAWLDTHPEQIHRLSDVRFLLRAMQETLRLHPVVPGFPRLATTDVTLESGKQIANGAIAILRSGPAGSAVETFGPDAAEFNPDRELNPNVSRFGLAFGLGPHMCFGMPIVIGTGGLDGSLIYVLRSVIAAGVRPDPRQSSIDLPATRGRFASDQIEAFLVEFPPRATESPAP